MGIDKASTIVNTYGYMTPQDLLNHFGTQQAIAEFFDIAPAAVCKWFSANEVPLGRQYEVQVRTAGRLVAVQPINAVPPAPTIQEAAYMVRKR